MEHGTPLSKSQGLETEELTCTSQYPQEISFFLLVSSVGVRGVEASVSNLPLVVELVVCGRSYVTQKLLPLVEADKKDPSKGEDQQEQQCRAEAPCRSEGPLLGLEPLHVVLQLDSTWRGSNIRQSGAGPYSVHGAEAAFLSQGGVYVALRTINDATPLGTAICYYPGDWFPLSPCGGEVQVQFKVCFQNDTSIKKNMFQVPREALKRVLFHNGLQDSVSFSRERHLSTDSLHGEMEDGNKCLRFRSVSGAARQVHSADVTPKGSVRSHGSKFSSGSPIDECSSIPACSSPTPSYDFACFSALSSNDISLFHMQFRPRKLSTSDHSPPLVEKRRGSHHTWMRECQPRSLVFSDIRVRGFTPLSSHGAWRLVFSWPHPKLSLRKRTVWIPSDVDETGAAVIGDTISIDLPLFVRGEMQTYVHAIWSGNSGEGTKTHLEVQVEFDPFVAFVQDSEEFWEEERHHSLVLADLMPVTASELSVRMVLRLHFFEPQRDGRNGRPTSAFPRRRCSMDTTTDPEDKDDVGYNHENRVGDEKVPCVEHTRETSNGQCAPQHTNHSSVAWDEQVTGNRSVSSTPASFGTTHLTQVNTLVRNTQPESKHDQREQQHGEQDLHEEQKHQKMQEGKKAKQQQQEHYCGAPPRSLQYLPISTGILSNLQDFVPCYTEQERRTVFEAYDTTSCGYITREQLLHFCRAHVALFNSEQSDASILRGLRPRVPGLARYPPNLFISPRQPDQTSPRDIDKTINDRGTNRFNFSGQSKEIPHGKSLSYLDHSPREIMTATPTTTVTTIRRVPDFELEGITYDVFGIIALHLASM